MTSQEDAKEPVDGNLLGAIRGVRRFSDKPPIKYIEALLDYIDTIVEEGRTKDAEIAELKRDLHDWKTASSFWQDKFTAAESLAQAERKRADDAEKMAVRLWALLDDLDTASDRYKDNYEQLAWYVYKKQRGRFEIMSGEQYDALKTKGAT